MPALLVLLMAASFPFLPIPVIEDLTPFQIGFIGLGWLYDRRGLPGRHRLGGRGQTEAAGCSG